jgi:hypothetical protein
VVTEEPVSEIVETATTEEEPVEDEVVVAAVEEPVMGAESEQFAEDLKKQHERKKRKFF